MRQPHGARHSTTSSPVRRKTCRHWQPFHPDSRIASAARTLELMSLAITYAEQKQALERYFERQNVDVFVAPFDLMKGDSNSHDIQSWCSWAEGVESLLPQTDLVILGRRDKTTAAVVAPWRDLARICSRHMQATEDDPARFRVSSFPVEEWREIESIGRKLTL